MAVGKGVADDDLFDEFGNYIGPEQEDQPVAAEDQPEIDAEEVVYPMENETKFAEVRQAYPSALQVYGDKVQVLYQQEDSQPLSAPIIQPVVVKTFQVTEKDTPETSYSKEFLADLMNFPERVRNVAIVGHLHHGKSSLLDLLVAYSHPASRSEHRYSDCTLLEKSRKISLSAKGMSLVLQSGKGKSHLVCAIDTPGHAAFSDQVASALRLADGVVCVVDVVEGMLLQTEETLAMAIAQGLPAVLALNKIDRLIVELRLPPTDAYLKIKFVLDQLNSFLERHSADFRFSPTKGNVLFSSCSDRWLFSLPRFAERYTQKRGDVDAKEFVFFLWGDQWATQSDDRLSFTEKESLNSPRSFVQFVLEPIYKIYSASISLSKEKLAQLLASVRIRLKCSEFELDARERLLTVLSRFFRNDPVENLVDALEEFIPSPKEAADSFVEKSLSGAMSSEMANAIRKCDFNGPLIVYVAKSLLRPEKSLSGKSPEFLCYARVLSGTIRKGQAIRVLGDHLNSASSEDSSLGTVEDLAFYECRYLVPVDQVLAGTIIAIGGNGALQSHIRKTAAIVEANSKVEFFAFAPLQYRTKSVIRLAIEPAVPEQLSILTEAIRRVSRVYPQLESGVEETGEHFLSGTGELYLDCVMHDIRNVFSDFRDSLAVHTSQPTVKFSETVLETSLLKCWSDTPNHRNRITMICEPLTADLAKELEAGILAEHLKQGNRSLASYLQSVHSWDVFAARNVLSFGPDPTFGPNILINDSLPTETDRDALASIFEFVQEGFRWASREGPLCEEPVRGVKFRLIDASLSQESIYRGSGQIIPAVRKICYSSMITGSPRLMEPIFAVEIQATSDTIEAIRLVLGKRRAHIIGERAIPATLFIILSGYIPVIDSFGFESDIRIVSMGQAFCQCIFSHWDLVPGDPLDPDVAIRPLEASDAVAMAKDFMLKTRRRKGMSDDVSIDKFLDDSLLSELTSRQLSLSSL